MKEEYLVIGRTNGTTRTGSPYVMLKAQNLNSTLNISVWDVAPDQGPQVGQLVSFLSVRGEADRRSCGAADMQVGTMPREDHPLYHLLPRPIPQQEWERCVAVLAGYCQDKKLRDIFTHWAERLYPLYARHPAATSMHHAYPGGLLNHTHQMLHMLEGLYPCLPYEIRIERCLLAILFHDYGKLREYNEQGDTQREMYLLGHIYMSTNTLHHILAEQGVDADETLRILHCVLAHHGTHEFGSPVVPCTQEAIVVTMLDNLSAKVDSAEGTGDMEKCFALGTHVVK